MRKIRLIARLDIKNSNLIKPIHLEGLRIVGDPNFYAKKYYEDGADELIFIDCVATLYGRNNLSNIIKDATRNIFIPITVGGGIRTLEDVRSILNCGADKVAVNTAAVKNPNFISEIDTKLINQVSDNKFFLNKDVGYVLNKSIYQKINSVLLFYFLNDHLKLFLSHFYLHPGLQQLE